MFAGFALLFIEDSVRISMKEKIAGEREIKSEKEKKNTSKQNTPKRPHSSSLGVVRSICGWCPIGRQHNWPFRHRPTWISVSMQKFWQEPLGRSQISLNLLTAAQRRGILELFIHLPEFL